MAIRRVKRALLCVSGLLLSWIGGGTRFGATPAGDAICSQPIHSAAGRCSGLGAICVAGADAKAAAMAYRQQVETKQAAVLKELASRNFQVFGSVSVLVNADFRERSGEPGGGIAEHSGSDRR